eukprot:TRINITY_DN4999_c0_g1_i1.p1 TRINITY_DN4999_c0_g1~~TRINITY_DN4999_c0_g1_i1.p1  ORF type:complete len:213 (-),score=27.43 TRINITY_DN4999_c0_g1_i1:77-715(-)
MWADMFGQFNLNVSLVRLITTGRFDACRVLMKTSPNCVNERAEYQKTPLHYAATVVGGGCLISELIESGAEVNAVDMWGMTPLHSAVDENRLDVVKLLLDNGARIGIRLKDGRTPLHLAVSKGNIAMILELLKRGADKFVTDINNRSPYTLAMNHRNPNIRKLIVDTLVKLVCQAIVKHRLSEAQEYLKTAFPDLYQQCLWCQETIPKSSPN